MYYLFIMRQVICWFVYIGKNPRFTAFLDSNFHTRLAIVTENELGLAFPPRNLSKKFRPDPSTFYLVIVVTNKQTNKQTNQRRWLHNLNTSVLSSLPQLNMNKNMNGLVGGLTEVSLLHAEFMSSNV